MNPLEAPNWNYRWTAILVEELLRQGVRHFFVSPGSRSTPLAWAIADHPAALCHVHFDERGAAFAALGCARALDAPTALVCTSGSAVANYFPAVVEADASRVPLLLLTADRPPELLDCGANQAIDQYKIFGDYLRWFQQLPCPGPELPATMLLTTIAQALRRATNAFAGPVQLNFAFREPLAPKPVAMPAPDATLRRWQDSGKPYTDWRTAPRPLSAAALRSLTTTLTEASRGLLLVGQLPDTEAAKACHALATTLGWPVCADATSNIHHPGVLPNALSYYDLSLRDPGFMQACAPDVVLHLGGPLVSKRLGQHLAGGDAAYLYLSDHPERQDPDHQVTARFEADLPTACSQVCQALSLGNAHPGGAWAETWQATEKHIDAYLSEQLENTAVLSEPGVLRVVARESSTDSVIFVGNSMPIRDLDVFGGMAASKGGPWVAANRGASGIDGNIATAWGWALGRRCPVTAVLGDLAALHDLNSLALLSQTETPFTLVLLNNDGGGIFSFLPVAAHPAHFERLFGAPHGRSFEAAARMFELPYYRPETMQAFTQAYAACQQRPGAKLIEVQTNRLENKQFHHALQAEIVNLLAPKSGE